MIPDRFPAADGDIFMSGLIDAGIAHFTAGIELTFSHRLDAQRLARAVDLTLDAHPVVGCRFVVDGSRLYWQRLEKKDRSAFHLLPNEAAFESFITEKVDRCAGPQIKAGLYRGAAGDRLLVKHAHQVADGGGQAEILRTLVAIYNRLKLDPAYEPEPDLRGSRQARQLLRQVPLRAFPVMFLNFLKLFWSDNVPKATHSLPLPLVDRDEPWTYKTRYIPPDAADRIIAYSRKHGATVNDLFMAAYIRALVKVAPWDGRSALRLQTTVDLRKWYMPENEPRGVYNMTSLERINLGKNLGDDFAATLKQVAARMQARKKSWFGLSEICFAPLLLALPYPLLVKFMTRCRRRQVLRKNLADVLTNTGPISPDLVCFDHPPQQALVLPHVLYPPPLSICLSGYAGGFTLATGAFRSSSALVESLLDAVAGELPK